MSDYDSSLPVRTQTNGDVVAKLVDGTTNTQYLGIDSSGKIFAKLNDGAGVNLTSQVNGGQQALDVGINVAGVQIDPRQIRALTSSDVVTAAQGAPNTIGNAWPVKPTDGTNSQSYTAAGEAKVSVTQPLPTGSNVIGSVNQGTSPWIVKDQADGPVGAGTAASFSQLAGAVYNSSSPSLTTGQQVALQVNASGRLLVVNDASVPTGTHVNDYKDASAIAAAGTDNHDYTVTAGKVLTLSSIIAAASGKSKMTVQVETGVASGVFTTYFVQFNSTANPDMQIVLSDPIAVAAGVRVRVIMKNADNQAQDLYSTICGTEN